MRWGWEAPNPNANLSICLSIYLSVHPAVHPSTYLPTYLSMQGNGYGVLTGASNVLINVTYIIPLQHKTQLLCNIADIMALTQKKTVSCDVTIYSGRHVPTFQRICNIHHLSKSVIIIYSDTVGVSIHNWDYMAAYPKRQLSSMATMRFSKIFISFTVNATVKLKMGHVLHLPPQSQKPQWSNSL